MFHLAKFFQFKFHKDYLMLANGNVSSLLALWNGRTVAMDSDVLLRFQEVENVEDLRE